jgi:hypothetical protein
MSSAARLKRSLFGEHLNHGGTDMDPAERDAIESGTLTEYLRREIKRLRGENQRLRDEVTSLSCLCTWALVDAPKPK